MEKLIRDSYDYVPHRVASADERRYFLLLKLREEVEEAETSGSEDELISELADLVEVCYALGGKSRVEVARHRKKQDRGGFDLGLIMHVKDAP